ncbi:rhomboid-related protein 3 isoform X3 [Mus musculus]|uniref:rhomboid-related protein 3 isoform 1 n=2 Tax=Murinae TaxID=39107 RepID=UPI0003D734F0|nr:rhomboid-related protein 3 isoform X3 [Mus musculus]|eukprot:XP_006533391.1 PREDICTED: rhomboid-related protein 3 isoform X3 [Mus musculus]
MGEHPSPGPAVAACAEAERIEELEPEAEERLPAAPEDFDPGSTGYISTGKFRSLLESHSSKLDPHKKEVLLALADSHADGQICYQDFVNLMSNKRSNSFRQAILQGNRRLSSKALLEEKGLSLSQRLIRHVAYETLPREIDRKWYYDSYTCCPPPWFMITITLLEVALFLYNGVLLDQFVLQVTHPRYLKNSLVYHPQLRAQAWRYVTYIFMHAGVEQLGLNVALQLLVGVPLEMVHGATRIGLVYVAGVVAELVRHEVPVQAAADGCGLDLYEYGVRKGCMAPFPPIGLSPVPPPKLCGTLGWRGRGHHPGRGGSQKLRAEAAGPVAVVDLCDHVHHLRAVCCLLEHLCLHTAGLEAATRPLRDQRSKAGRGNRSIPRKYLHLLLISNSVKAGRTGDCWSWGVRVALKGWWGDGCGCCHLSRLV